MKIKRLRPTPGVLIGTIALVFAFTGGAVAAQTVNTNDIAKKAVTGSRIAKDAVKSGKIADGKIKAKDLASDVIPEVPAQAYGRVNKNGNTVAPETGAVGIAGTSSGGDGLICYDLATLPVSGTASVAPLRRSDDHGRGERQRPGRVRRPVHGRGDGHPSDLERQPGRQGRLREFHRRLTGSFRSVTECVRAAPGWRRSCVSPPRGVRVRIRR